MHKLFARLNSLAVLKPQRARKPAASHERPFDRSQSRHYKAPQTCARSADESLYRKGRKATLRVLAGACKHMQMTLVIETPLPHLIGGHPDEFAAVVSPLDRAVGVCFDTAHTTLGHHWDRFMAVAGDRLVHVHANDHRGHFDDHLPPGLGVIDWRHIRETLVRARFDGWIVLELACPPGPLDVYMSDAMRRARELFE